MFMDLGLIDHVRKLSDNNTLTTWFSCFNFGTWTKDNRTLTSLISTVNTRFPHDQASSWKVRSRKNFHQFTCCNFRIIHHQFDSINRFSQIVWWNVSRHTNSNPCRTIDKKVGNTWRKNDWLTFWSIIVILEIYGILVKITKHFQGDFRHTRLSITLSGSPISVHRTKVPVTINQHVTVAPPLCHTNHGFIDRWVPVWVIFTHDIPGNTGRFFMWLIRCHPKLIHSIKNTTLYRF